MRYSKTISYTTHIYSVIFVVHQKVRYVWLVLFMIYVVSNARQKVDIFYRCYFLTFGSPVQHAADGRVFSKLGLCPVSSHHHAGHRRLFFIFLILFCLFTSSLFRYYLIV